MKWRTLAALTVGLVTVASASAQDASSKSPFEISDYYRTAFVSGPLLSPDGSRIAVTVSRYDLEAGESWSEIWLMGGHGTRPRQMTHGRHADTAAGFSPDGKSLLFVSDRAGEATQLFVMAVDGGEAQQLTSFPAGISSPLWSPDGRWIAVSSRVFPECGADPECNRTLLEAGRDGPLMAYVTDELLYRHWNRWREGRFAHILLVDAGSGAVVRDLTPGRWDSPTFTVGGEVAYAFSPDGREFCFVSNRDPAPATSTNSDLWTVTIDGECAPEAPRKLTEENTGWDGDPRYSPDGRYIAYRSQQAPGYESDLYRIALFDRQTESVRYLTERSNFDNWVSSVEWHPGGDSLLFQAEEKGRTPLYRIGLRNRELQRLHTDGAISGWIPTPDGKAIVYTRSRIGSPPEVFRVPTTGGEAIQLSSFNSKLIQEVDIRPAEELWVKGAGDYELQVFLVKPHDFDPTRKYPLILNVHGGPQSPWTDRYRGDWQVYPGKGYVVAFPNPTGSAGFGQDFVDAIGCDYTGRVYADLMRVTDELSEIPWVDSDRMGAMGWSWGGYMMMWFEGHTKRFKALAAMMGLYDLRSWYGSTEELWFPRHDLCALPWKRELFERWSPSDHAETFATPCLVITGERDYRVPYTQSLQFFTDLQLKAVPSKLIVFPNAGHWPAWNEMAVYYLAHLDWFHQYLGGEAPGWKLQEFLRNETFEGSVTLARPEKGERGP
jgi:dipeptidyl aminopeptidase/acylaminoacyl peptidase